VVVLEDLGLESEETVMRAGEVAAKVRAAMALPFTLGSSVYRCAISIGIAPFESTASSVEGVLRQADLAMYQAKAAGRNTIRFFDHGMQQAADERLALEEDLRAGIHAQQMLLYVQPQVSHHGTVTGGEVLLRWAHPKRGLVPPGVFIPVAEATGLIVPLGEWVLEAVCQKLALWASDPQLSQLTLSVNVSVRQFSDAGFVNSVLRVLQETGADPHRLRLEITESLLAKHIDEVIGKMCELIKHGITFSLDDFGTGYSSLSYLRRMPLYELKIDRSFVQDVLENEHDASIARIIISLAVNLGLVVIAEGVETEGQHRFLAEHGCHHYQGYLFGKPSPIAAYEEAHASATPAPVAQ
jgi:EAL domain-containing protein (putative c-di-GMP-specific phosphodiesterase class I)